MGSNRERHVSGKERKDIGREQIGRKMLAARLVNVIKNQKQSSPKGFWRLRRRGFGDGSSTANASRMHEGGVCVCVFCS